MNKRKVCVVITARPSYSRIRTALDAIAKHQNLELQIVVAGSALLDRYGSTVDIIEADGFTVSRRVYMVLEGENLAMMAKTTGLGLIELATAFDSLNPDMVVTIADRYETIATAIAASYMNIPLVHIQGGEVTGSIDEKVRHAVTKLSDVHLVSTELAKQRVVRMGEDPAHVFLTGCPSIDIALEVRDNPRMDFDVYEKYGGVGSKPPLDDGYLVVLQHPVTTEYQRAHRQAEETLEAIHRIGLPTLWFWPNVDAGSDATADAIRGFRENARPTNIHFLKNTTPTDFLRLLIHSKGIVGNSSVAIRECAFLGVPAVNIGTRQWGRERGKNVIDVDHDRLQIAQAILAHLQKGPAPADHIYGDGFAGPRIANLLSNVDLTVEKRFVMGEFNEFSARPLLGA